MTGPRTSRLLVLTLAVALSAACSAVHLKDTVTRGTQTAHTLASSAQDAEIAAYQAGLAGITPDQHKNFHGAFVAYWDAEIQIVELLKTWRAGDPPPVGLRAQLVIASESLQAVREHVPWQGAQTLTTALVSAVDAMLQLITALDGGAQ